MFNCHVLTNKLQSANQLYFLYDSSSNVCFLAFVPNTCHGRPIFLILQSVSIQKCFLEYSKASSFPILLSIVGYTHYQLHGIINSINRSMESIMKAELRNKLFFFWTDNRRVTKHHYFFWLLHVKNFSNFEYFLQSKMMEKSSQNLRSSYIFAAFVIRLCKGDALLF